MGDIVNLMRSDYFWHILASRAVPQVRANSFGQVTNPALRGRGYAATDQGQEGSWTEMGSRILPLAAPVQAVRSTPTIGTLLGVA